MGLLIEWRRMKSPTPTTPRFKRFLYALRHPLRGPVIICPQCDGEAGWKYPVDYGNGWEYDSCSGCHGRGLQSPYNYIKDMLSIW